MTKNTVCTMAVVTTVSLCGLGALPAAAQPSSTTRFLAPADLDVKHVEGKISSVEPGVYLTMLRLDDGTLLAVPDTTRATAEPLKIGDTVQAQYRATGTENVVTWLRVEPDFQAP